MEFFNKRQNGWSDLAKYRIRVLKKVFIFDTVVDARTMDENIIDNRVKILLDGYLFESGLFKESEDHILTTPISDLSGGQQARVLTAYALSGVEQIVLLDEALERTTQS